MKAHLDAKHSKTRIVLLTAGLALQIDRRRDKAASILARPPLKSEGFSDLMPVSARMPRTMIGAHARTLAMKPFGIPASGRALLMFLIQLNNIHLAETPKRLLDKIVEPRDRRLPALIFGVPLRLVLPFATKPSPVIFCVRDARQNRKRPILAIDNRYGVLTPNFAKTRILTIHVLSPNG